MADVKKNVRSGQGKGTGKVTSGKRGTGKVSSGRKAQPQRSAKSGTSGKVKADSRQQQVRAADTAVKEEQVVPQKAAAPSSKGTSTQAGKSSHVVGDGVRSTRVRDRKRLSSSMRKETRLRLFLQSSAPDFVLVALVAVCLSYTVSYGFYSADAFRGNVLLLVVMTLPLLVALFAGSWSKRAVLFSAVGTSALCVMYLVMATALSPDPSLFNESGINDSPDNYILFVLVVCVITIVVYLLSRRTWGLVLLLAIGIVSCGAVQYLWREWIPQLGGLVAFVLALLGMGMLFVYQTYKQSIYSANRVKSTSFGGAFGYSLIIGLACVLVSAGVFGVIGQVAPGTVQFKPFEELVSQPTTDQKNSWDSERVEGDEETNNTNDEKDETLDDSAEGNDRSMDAAGPLGSAIQAAAQAMAGYDPNDSEQEYDNIAYLIIWYERFIIAALIVLALLAAVLIRYFMRSWRLKRIEKRSASYQVWYLYNFLLGRFKKLKLVKPAHLTPLEFAVGFSKPMLPFTRGSGDVDFVDVSRIYQDAVFGGIEPTEDQLNDVRRYYWSFYKNARDYVGIPKWIFWKYWRV